MTVVTLKQAQEQLEQLARKADSGEEIVISREGAPPLRLVPQKAKRQLGGLEHLGWKIPDDFNTMFDKEIEEMFYGSSEDE
jgi:antitoxin (DNA-binding transcriptional repressor) of toxin-antitoxin stability system